MKNMFSWGFAFWKLSYYNIVGKTPVFISYIVEWLSRVSLWLYGREKEDCSNLDSPSIFEKMLKEDNEGNGWMEG